MENLQLKHLAPYLSYDLKIFIPDGKGIGTLDCLLTGGTTAPFYFGIKESIGEHNPDKWHIKPLLIPLSEMINLMEKFLCDLCLFDLSDCIFHCEYDETEHSYYVNASYIDEVRASLIWNGNVFEIYYNDHSENDKFDTYSPQINALNLFYKYHIDINELIDAGLALNKLEYFK